MAENEKNNEIVESGDAKAADSKSSKDVNAKKNAPKKDKVKFTERIKKFFREYKSELKKIVWYSRKDTINSSILVIVCIVVVSAITGALDFGFSNIIRLLGKLI